MKVDREQFKHIVSDTWDSINKLSASKGVEYTGHEGSKNVHANFDRLSLALQIIPEKILMVYLTKHMDSIATYVNSIPVKVMSEPIESRIDDAILYLILLRAMVWRSTSMNKAPSNLEVIQEVTKRNQSYNPNWDRHTDVP
jgi:hypothetical protein